MFLLVLRLTRFFAQAVESDSNDKQYLSVVICITITLLTRTDIMPDRRLLNEELIKNCFETEIKRRKL